MAAADIVTNKDQDRKTDSFLANSEESLYWDWDLLITVTYPSGIHLRMTVFQEMGSN